MMDILVVSKEDICRSRIAKELILSFGRGIKVTTAGVTPGLAVQESVIETMKGHGLDIVQSEGTLIDDLASKKWPYIITLCPEAEEAVDLLQIVYEYKKSFNFSDIFADSVVDLPLKLESLHETMFRELFRFWRDDLRDNIMPTCTCGANTFCRCE